MSKGEFHLVIEKLETRDPAGASRKFADSFGLDPALTETMLKKTVPVLFISDLTKKEVRAIMPRLEALSNEGFEFRITSRIPKIPKVNWLMRPDFTVAGSGSSAVAFNWQNQAFVCPGCGETFLFQHVGPLPFSEATELEPETVEAQPTAAAVSAPPKPAPAPAPEDTQPEPEPEPEPEAAPPPPPQIKFNVPAPKAQVEAPPEPPSLELEGDDPPPTGDMSEVVPLDDLPPAAATDIEAPVVQEGTLSAALDEAVSGAALQPSANGGESFNVFVPEVKDPNKREEVVRLISDVRKCSPDEARKLTRRIMIPVAKNVSRQQAESILGEFRKLRITGRMTKATREDA